MATAQAAQTLAFAAPDLQDHLDQVEDAELDTLDFGVIGFDATGVVCCYNALESRLAGLTKERVRGNPLFKAVASTVA